MATPSSFQSSVPNGCTPEPDSHTAPVMAEPNVGSVVLGDIIIRPWFPSFYPEELIGRTTERLYTCQWCFKYSKELIPFIGHVKVCPSKESGPPGQEIYAKDNYSINEVDGEEFKLYSQNLSLFAKLFLDTKSVFYDVTTFLYYLLVHRDPATGLHQVIGFFSKEKMSWDNNNLACILVFPPWQKQGHGQLLMAVSYELSKRDGRLGGPEKPLSDLGRRGYLAYWSGVIVRYIVAQPAKSTMTVKDISDATYMVPEDITTTLKEMNIIERKKKKGGSSVFVNRHKVLHWANTHRVSLDSPVDVEAFSEGILPEEEEPEDEDTDEEMDDEEDE